MIDRRALLAALPVLVVAGACRAAPSWADRLLAAAQSQVGRTLSYDPLYTPLAYPGGDVPLERGVCTDVVIRAYRDAFGIDLQRLVHEDMARAFAAYPTTWGLKRPDANIDHRRVPNLEVFLTRRKTARPTGETWRAGDLITVRLPGNHPHIMIATGQSLALPEVIHNIGGGARRELMLHPFRQTGHFRWPPTQQA